MRTVVQARVDEESRKAAEEIFHRMGMSISDGIRIFICQVINQNGLPFRPELGFNPNKETRKVIEDAEKGIGLSKAYTDLDELFKDLDIC